MPEGIPRLNEKWVSLPAKSSRWWSLVSFPICARKLGADIIHTQYSVSPLARKAVTTVHDVSFFVGPEWFQPKDRFLLRRTVPAAIRRAKSVITVSETSRSEIEQFIPSSKGKVVAIPNACPNWIQPIPKSRARNMVEQIGIKDPYMLTVGTRWPRKNMELTVRAAEELSRDFPHKLVITGKQGWGDMTVGNRCHATGYVDHLMLSALYSAAELYLAPSRHEGFGLPILEAFRCGCPVVCSSGGAFPEVAGDSAEVMGSWEVADWTAKIESLLGDSSKLESLRNAGKLREQRFSWRETAERTIEVYRGVMR